MYNLKSNNDVEKIADVYCFDDTTDMGYYNSYRNFCKRNMIYFSFVYGSKNMRVYSTPEKVLVSEKSSENIRVLLSDKILELKEVTSNEAENFSKYILIVYTDGRKKYFAYKEGFEEIFKIYVPEERTQEMKVLSEPYLIFETQTASNKAKIIESISKNINRKEFKELFKMISEDCILEILGEEFKGIQSIKKEYKKRVGVLKIKLLKTRVYTMIEGTLDENKNSILELKLEIRDKSYKEHGYVIHMDFNQIEKINKISISLYEDRIAKIISGKDLNSIKSATYNDFK